MPIAGLLVELPFDHFRLLGVSPSAEAEVVLRALQLRIDRSPEQGFTDEVLTQRAELLRLSADLLSDPTRREEYEVALLGGATGLEFSSSREVAALILLWEADCSFEAFKLASQALQPPQAPALGSGREADLTLLAALSCSSAAIQEQERRHYASAAAVLQEGMKLLQRMGKLPNQRKQLEEDLDALLPYRILDLLSRDLGDQISRQEGLRLLDGFVNKRGGLEGKRKSSGPGSLNQEEFELFFQQIRKFLTVQEQVDLFVHWQHSNSSDARFLAIMSMTAEGFSRRKPERIYQARKKLERFAQEGLDQMPLLGCMDLLLGDVQLAHKRFENSEDSALRSWLEDYSGERLAALCSYCRDWLRRDVLPGYRDVDSQVVDLEAWFADRDVQVYLERIDKKGDLTRAKDKALSFLSAFTPETSSSESEIDQGDSSEISMKTEVRSENEVDQSISDNVEIQTQPEPLGQAFHLLSFQSFFKGFISKRNIFSGNFLRIKPIFFGSFAILVALSGFIYYRVRYLDEPQKESLEPSSSLLEKLQDQDSRLGESTTNPVKETDLNIEALTVARPSEKQIRELIQAWLVGKANILSGGQSNVLKKIARRPLLESVNKERAKDAKLGQKQFIDASIYSIRVINRTPKRIEVKARINYKDIRLDSSGKKIDDTSNPNLKVTYIIGRYGEPWLLHYYVSGR